MLDFVNQDEFSCVELAAALELMPYKPSFLGQMGLFQEEGIRRTTVAVEIKDGTLQLVETQPRNSWQANYRAPEKSRIKAFTVPHLPIQSRISADDFPDRRAFGTEDGIVTLMEEVNDRNELMRNDLEVTIEYHRLGCLKGLILDANGSVLVNLFDEFEVDQNTVSFNLHPNADPAVGFTQLIRKMTDALGATPVGRIVGLAGDTIFDKMVRHPLIRAEKVDANMAEFNITNHVYQSFTYQGVTIINYRGRIGSVDFIDAEKVHFFPSGARGTFRRWNAPPVDVRWGGRKGVAFVPSVELLPHGVGMECKLQANPLHLCLRPACLIEGSFVEEAPQIELEEAPQTGSEEQIES